MPLIPTERKSFAFRDISATFKINPINDDLIGLKNENAIARSIRNLILTVPGEKPFNPQIGCRVSALLFENFDSLTANSIKREIEYTVDRYEPRVKLRKVEVEADLDSHTFHVVIRYDIVGILVPAQEIQFALVPTR